MISKFWRSSKVLWLLSELLGLKSHPTHNWKSKFKKKTSVPKPRLLANAKGPQQVKSWWYETLNYQPSLQFWGPSVVVESFSGSELSITLIFPIMGTFDCSIVENLHQQTVVFLGGWLSQWHVSPATLLGVGYSYLLRYHRNVKKNDNSGQDFKRKRALY